MSNNLLTDYSEMYDKWLVKIAENLNENISSNLIGLPRVDRVSARAKSPKRFFDKAMKENNGVRKYSDPLTQIQDLIGARIIVFYLQDVERISVIINKYYRSIESKTIIPDSESQFGYVGKHFILRLPEDVIDDEASTLSLPSFFELQIKTLFQHAWSEACHDLSYKPLEPLNSSQKRQIAFTAAQAWGADHHFGELFSTLGANDD